MKSKKILVVLSDAPMEETFIEDDLRTSLGMSAGYKDHQVDLLLTGNAVYLLNILQNHNLLQKFIKIFSLLDSTIYLDKKSIEEHNIDTGQIEKPFKLSTRDEIIKLMNKSGFVLSL